MSHYSDNQFDRQNQNTSWFKIINMIPKGSSVLDVGCSAGNLGEYLKISGLATSVVGIDIDKGDVKIAAQKLDKALIMDIENDPLTPLGKYDVIIFADVLEHMKDPVKVLQKVKKLLTQNGRIVFSIPNMAHMFVRLQLLEGNFRYMERGLLDHTHLHFYDDYEVKRIFTESGFAVKKYDCTTFDYPDGLLKEKLAKIGLKPTKQFFEIAHSKQAVFFEYVGYAQPSDKPIKKMLPAGTSSPLNEVLAFVQRIKDADTSKIKELERKVKLSEAHIQKLEAERNNSRHPLRFVTNKILHDKRHDPSAK